MSITIKRTLCPTGSVENSDATYSNTVDSGGSLVLPDSDVNVNGSLEGSVVSVKDIDVNITDSSGTVTPDSVTIVGNTVTIDVPDSNPAPVGATLMKTGQTTSYRTGDDGDIEAGRATDWYTLAVNNPFGNTNRFTDELGGSTYANNIVIDWSTYDTVGGTVLGIYRIPAAGNVTWAVAIDTCLALSVGTFTSGWRLWNINEMNNFTNWSLGTSNVFGWSPLSFALGSFWTSTKVNATNVIRQAYSGTVSIGILADSAAQKWAAVRTFTVTGTTLT